MHICQVIFCAALTLNSNEINELIASMTDVISPHFTDSEIDILAQEAGFIKRKKGVITGANFLDLIVFHSESLKQQSLNDISLDFYERTGQNITKQSLHDRFNVHAVQLLRNAIEHMLSKRLSKIQTQLTTLKGFERIQIKDSTSFQISKELEQYYKGSGGSGSPAAMRIQFEYDLLTGSVMHLALTPFITQDATDAITSVEFIQKGALIIRDLGYMHLKSLAEIIKREAFYLARLQAGCNVYEKKANGTIKKINFASLRKTMLREGREIIEKTLLIGEAGEHQLESRVIIELLSTEIAEQRLAKAAQRSSSKNRTSPGKEYRSRAHFNIFLTNASKEQLPISMAGAIYSLRWQIEMMFKIWKSICSIHEVKKVKLHRLECYIYAKLLMILFCWEIIWKLLKVTFKSTGKFLSLYKCYKWLYSKAECLRFNLINRDESVNKLLRLMIKSLKNFKLEKHGKTMPQLELLIELCAG